MDEMYHVFVRWLVVASACVVSACSTTPTGPSSTTTPGPIISQGPLAGLYPQGSPPVPPRIAGPMPSALGATRFVAFGDSLTAGTMSSYDGSFVFDAPDWAYSVRLKLALDTYHRGDPAQPPRTYTVINEGVPGEWASGSLGGESRIQGVITQHRPQGLLLLEGINDLANERSITETVDALRRIIDRARASNVTVLIATMPQTYETCPPPVGTPCRDNARQLVPGFNQALRTMASGRQNVYIVDLYAAFGTDHAYMGNDGLHPTEQGYELMASQFLARIETVFGIRSSFQ
jgi:lysophospholipase L1-like esterase